MVQHISRYISGGFMRFGHAIGTYVLHFMIIYDVNFEIALTQLKSTLHESEKNTELLNRPQKESEY